jgi:hypothetical protein
MTSRTCAIDAIMGFSRSTYRNTMIDSILQWSKTFFTVRTVSTTVRMPEHRLPKQLLYGELSQGKRTAGGQKKRYKDSLKASLKALGFDLNTWETLALDRPAWRSNLTRGAHAAELQRTADAENKRAARKARAASTPTSAPTHMCPTCERALRARISLTSHLRTHRLCPRNISWSRGLLRPRRTNSSVCVCNFHFIYFFNIKVILNKQH